MSPSCNIVRSLTERWQEVSLFAAGALTPTVTGFLLLPIYTRFLSHAEFGAFTLITASYGLFSAVTLLGLNSAIVREYHEYDDVRARRELVGAVTCVVAGVSIAAGLVLAVVAWLAPGWGPSLIGTGRISLVAGIVIYFVLQNVYAIQLATARASANAHRYFLVAGSHGAALVCSVIALLTCLKLGLEGYISAAVVAGGCGAVVGARISGHSPAWPAGWGTYLRPTLAFGVPLVAVNLTGWGVSAIDRYLVNGFLGLDATGTYGLAYRLGSLAKPLLLVPFAAMFPPILFKRMAETGFDDAASLVRRAHLAVVGVVALIAALISVATGPLLLVFGGTAYLDAAPTLRWVAWGFVGYASYYVMTNIFALLRATGLIALLTSGALVVNVAINTLLIPRYGVAGAGIASCLTYAGLAIATQGLARAAAGRMAGR